MKKKKHFKRLWQYRDLFRLLVFKDLRIKYKGSILGYFWSILDPIAQMLVLTLVFSSIFKSRIENYPVYLLSGRIVFHFISSSTSTAMHSVVGNSSLIQKTNVPRYLFGWARVTSGLIDLFFELVALFIVMILTATPFSLQLLWIPVLVLPAYIFTVGFGLLLAALAVFYRDVYYVYGVFVSLWTYLTPLFYPMESIPANLANIIKRFNPAYYYIYNFRHIILERMTPDWTVYSNGMMIALFTLVIGIVVFNRKKKDFILYL